MWATSSVVGILAIAGVALAAAHAEHADPGLFEWEKVQLSDEFTSLVSSKNSPYFKPYDGKVPAGWADRKCRPFPSDPDWPQKDAWDDLNKVMGGALLKPTPVASVCYNGTEYNNYSPNKCQAVSNDWRDNFNRMDHPLEVVSAMWEGLTCLPPSSLDTKGCTQGGYPVYVANISTTAHVQAAVNFARNTGVRLVVRNTGHELSGKSQGGGSLSVWTHGLKEIRFYSDFTVEGYTGPAFRVGSGVQGFDILKAAQEKGHMVVTGICDSVGMYGGYSQGGGHSLLGALHGMAADQILSLQVVTADGKFLTTSPSENTDLFWAIRGGGGSTFGVVTSMTVKAFPDKTTSVATFDWSITDSKESADAFWAGIASYFGRFENFTSQGLTAQFNIYTNHDLSAPPEGKPRILVSPFLGVGKTLSELKAATKPMLDEMVSLGINVTTTWAEFPSYLPAYYSELAKSQTGTMPYNMGYGSRLVPRDSFNKAKGLNATVAVYRAMVEAGHGFNGFQLSPTLETAAPVGGGNAVLPAWRTALSHSISFFRWPIDAPAAEQIAIRKRFSEEGMRAWRAVTPGGGSYMAESDIYEPEWQKEFFGDNYVKLLEIKKKHDPYNVFWAPQTVGSEAWAVKSVEGLPTQNGPLCRV